MKIESPNSYLTNKELITKYKKLAPKADARLRRIEAKIGQAKYKGIENYAYKAARDMIKNIIGLSDGKPRFDRNISNLSRGQIEAMVGHVEQFIDYDTSTLSGYKTVWQTRANTFNDNNVKEGLHVSVQEYRYLWESEKFKEMADEYGYRDAFDSVMEGVNEGMTMQDAIDLAYKRIFMGKYMEQISKIEGNVRTYTDKMRNVYPEGYSSELAKELKDIQNKLAQGEKIPTMDMTEITPPQPVQTTSDQMKTYIDYLKAAGAYPTSDEIK